MGEYIQGSIEISLSNNAINNNGAVHSAKKQAHNAAVVGWQSQSQAQLFDPPSNEQRQPHDFSYHDPYRSSATRCAAARVMHAGHGSTGPAPPPRRRAMSRWMAA
jgi:hypothetical protein